MIGQLLVWIYISFVLLGIGFLSQKAILLISKSNKSISDYGPVHLIFVGFLILHTFLGYITLIAPIGKTVHLVIVLISLLALVLHRNILKDLILKIKKELKPLPIYILIPPTLFLLLILSNSLYSFNHYDTGLYYLQNIQWIEQYPVVKGLANIHSRFGFNSHFLIDSSFFTLGFLNLKSGNEIIRFYSLNSLLFFLLTIKIIFNLGRYFRAEKWYLFALNFLILFFSYSICATYLPNPTPDFISVVFISYLVIYILDKENSSSGISEEVFIFISILVFTLVTIKISNAVLALLCLFYFYRFKARGFIYLAVIAIAVMAPFFIRNVLISGYLVYPAYILDYFNYDWKVPYALARSDYNWTKSWSILPGKTPDEVFPLSTSEWFMDWFSRQKKYVRFLLAITPFSIISLFVSNKIGRSHKYLILSFILSLIYWFISAPNPRFIWGILICLGSLTIASFISLIPKSAVLKWVLALLLAYISFFEVGDPTRKISDMWGNHGKLPAQPPKVEVKIKKLVGFDVNIPVQGDRCFNEPIPCTTPHVNRKVSMRGETYKDGFRPNN